MNVVHLQVEVEGDCIIVSMPGTSFRATYLKSQDPRDQRQLVESLAMAIDKEASVPRKEFEAKPWEAATAKARELGWIV